MAQTKFDPERWLETTIRGIKDYVELSPLVNNRIYQVVMEFPGPQLDQLKMPMRKTLIHFELDADPANYVGFGDNVFAWNYDPVTKAYDPQEAREHRMDFDVGVWASDSTGGSSSRMKAHQMLSVLFGGTLAHERLRQATDNGDGYIELINFTGGRFALDTVADMTVYRTINCTLEVRVYSRTPRIPDQGGPTIEEIDQVPNLTVE